MILKFPYVEQTICNILQYPNSIFTKINAASPVY